MSNRSELDNDLRKIMKDVANKMARDLRRQVPQRGQNPYATGKLKSRLAVEARKDADGNWSIFMTYPSYGNYTAFGTRQYSNWREQTGLNIFDRAAFSGYRKGRGGIRPQNWLSLSRERQEYEDLIQEQLGESLEVFVDRLVTLGIGNRPTSI